MYLYLILKMRKSLPEAALPSNCGEEESVAFKELNNFVDGLRTQVALRQVEFPDGVHHLDSVTHKPAAFVANAAATQGKAAQTFSSSNSLKNPVQCTYKVRLKIFYKYYFNNEIHTQLSRRQ